MKLCYCDIRGNIYVSDLSTEDLKTEAFFTQNNKVHYALRFNKDSTIPSRMKDDIRLESIHFCGLLEKHLYEGSAGGYRYMLINEADLDIAKHKFLKVIKASINLDKEACLRRIEILDKLYTTVDMADHNKLETNEEDIER